MKLKMFLALKIINALRFLLNVATVILFIDYFDMHGSPTADELPFFAGLFMLLVPTILLWAADLTIYAGMGSTRNFYLTFLANAHFLLFVLMYIAGQLFLFVDEQLIEFDGYSTMLLMFLLLLIGSVINIYQFFSFKRPVKSSV